MLMCNSLQIKKERTRKVRAAPKESAFAYRVIHNGCMEGQITRGHNRECRMDKPRVIASSGDSYPCPNDNSGTDKEPLVHLLLPSIASEPWRRRSEQVFVPTAPQQFGVVVFVLARQDGVYISVNHD
jgi:hypothetical protein